MFFETHIHAKKTDKCGTCHLCERKNVRLTRDHIIPKIFGGLGISHNIQLICGECNSNRGNKIDVNIWKKMNWWQRKMYVAHHLRKTETILQWRSSYSSIHTDMLDLWYDLKALEKTIYCIDEGLARIVILKLANIKKQ